MAEVTDSEGDGEPVQATARLIRNDVWVTSPRFAALPAGKRWIHSTLPKLPG